MELANNMDARPRFLFNVVLLDAPPPRQGEPKKKGEVYVMKAPSTVRSAIVKMDRDEPGGWHDVTSPFHGVNLRITKEGQGLNTKYHVLPSGARTPIVEYLASVGITKTLDELKAGMHDLDGVFPHRSYEEAKSLVARASRRRGLARKAEEVPVSAPTTASAPAAVTTPGVVPPIPTSPAAAPVAPPPPPRPKE